MDRLWRAPFRSDRVCDACSPSEKETYKTVFLRDTIPVHVIPKSIPTTMSGNRSSSHRALEPELALALAIELLLLALALAWPFACLPSMRSPCDRNDQTNGSLASYHGFKEIKSRGSAQISPVRRTVRAARSRATKTSREFETGASSKHHRQEPMEHPHQRKLPAAQHLVESNMLCFCGGAN